MTLRVSFLCPEFPPEVGGLGDYTDHLARGLAALGVDVEVLTRGPLDADNAGGPGSVAVQPLQHWGFRLPEEVRCAVAPGRILHIQYQTGAYGMHPGVNLLPGRLSPGLPAVTTWHDLRPPYLFPLAGPLRQWSTRRLATSSSVLVATNDTDAELLRSLSSRPVHVIPIGPNIDPVPDGAAAAWQVRARWNVPLSASLVGYFGFINHSKGVPVLLQAFRALLDRGVPAILLLAGEPAGASDRNNKVSVHEAERLVDKLRLGSEVRWTGSLAGADLSRCLAALDCCVLPFTDGASYRRGTLVSALAHGVPIVTTTGDACRAAAALEPLVDGQHCLIVPPGEPEALSQALQRVIETAPVRQQLSEGALALASQFTWDGIVQQHVRLYESMPC